MLYLIVIIPFLNLLLVLLEVFVTFARGNGLMKNAWAHVAPITTVIGLPILFWFYNSTLGDFEPCGESAILNHKYSMSFYGYYLMAVVAYFTSYFVKNSLPPLLELLLPIGLLIGMILSLLMMWHLGKDNVLTFIGALPIFLMFLQRLYLNDRRLRRELDQLAPESNRLLKIYLYIQHHYWLKVPVLLVLCFPVMALLTGILYLFGQSPGDIIQSFSETCSYELSRTDYCGECVDGHYLCTIAAYGNPKLVKPLRMGYRHGKRIVVNRQLLASNAFEEYVQELSPRLHRVLRRNYDKYGLRMAKFLHQSRFSNCTYLLMKPLEWGFIMVLYTCTKNPETRIHRQYLLHKN